VNRVLPVLLNICFLTLFASCKKVVEGFNVSVGQNDVTTVVSLTDDYALALSGEYPIVVKDVHYGNLFLNGATTNSPFQLGVTAKFDMFTSDTWEGFGTTNTLPNGDPMPGWITPYELVAVDIPSFSPHFDLILYVGYQSPYYLGLAISLNVLDNHYPEGLSVSQSFKKDGKIWGTVHLFGPSRDSDGNVVTHGGVFFAATFDPLLPGRISFKGAKAQDMEFHGPHAETYSKDKKLQKKAIKQIQQLIQDFNMQM
jgi:hypothetical protein